MNLKAEIVQLAHSFERENDAARDLWSWLPSHKEAEKHHGDYASEFMPGVADVMVEAALFIAHGMNPTAEQIGEAGEMYLCPCGEYHDEEDQSNEESGKHLVELELLEFMKKTGEVLAKWVKRFKERADALPRKDGKSLCPWRRS